MKCYQCGNEDERYFAYDKGVYYCRKCVAFGRMDAYVRKESCHLSTRVIEVSPQLKYELTDKQKAISHKIVEYLKQKKDVFVYAATGAGKTESVFECICFYLSQGKKVGFAISRRQVVLEIAQRLRQAFPTLHIVEVTQGYTTITDGDIIVCTMHQLYRYPDGFDLLIMDEVDAFPYVGNDVLQTITRRACKGQRVLLSATPDEESLQKIKQKEMEMVTLFERPHKHPLVVPKVYECNLFFQMLMIIGCCYSWIRQSKQVLVFVPRRQDCIWLNTILKLFFRSSMIHSQTKEKDEILDQFRQKGLDVLVCTTLLERGITVPSVQVIVCQADHAVFTSASLIQIFGRVGRSFDNPTGKGVCLCFQKNQAIKECVDQLCQMNASASTV